MSQPKTFIQNVTLVGAGGRLGPHILRALLATEKHSITALSRHNETLQLPSHVKCVEVNFSDEQELVDALRYQQFLIIVLAGPTPPGVELNLIRAAGKANVQFIMPNWWFADFENEKLTMENLTGNSIYTALKAIEETEVCSWIALVCSFWYEYSLSQGPQWFGFDFAKHEVTFYDSGNTKISTTSWEQCGRAVAALLSLKISPINTNDTSPTISMWMNKPLKISSFSVSQRDMLDSVNRIQGKRDTDWEIKVESSASRWRRGMSELPDASGRGRYLAMITTMYARTFFPNGDGRVCDAQLANGLLGLPEEDLDEITRRALNMVP